MFYVFIRGLDLVLSKDSINILLNFFQNFGLPRFLPMSNQMHYGFCIRNLFKFPNCVQYSSQNDHAHFAIFFKSPSHLSFHNITNMPVYVEKRYNLDEVVYVFIKILYHGLSLHIGT